MWVRDGGCGVGVGGGGGRGAGEESGGKGEVEGPPTAPGHFGLRFFDSHRVLFRVCLSAWKYICTNTLHKT